MVVIGPLIHIHNGNLPCGVRKVEFELNETNLDKLKGTIPKYNNQSLLKSLRNAVSLYKELRMSLFDDTIVLQKLTEQKVMLYFDEIENRSK